MKDREIQLETAIAFQDDTINQLSDVVRAQADAIEFLEKRLSRLEATVRELQETAQTRPLDDGPPPHY